MQRSVPTAPQPQPLRRVPLYQQVVERLRELIVSGQLGEGDRLPTEDALALQFGVSRTVVREAIRVLRERGVLEVNPGRGIQITRPTASFVAEAVGSLFREFGDVSVENFLEVRELLEQQIARLAAERATPEDLARLEQCVRTVPGPDQAFDANLAFHVALAKATKNPLLCTLLEVLIGRTGQISHAVYDRLPGVPERIDAFHQEILDRVRARDAGGAEDATRRHMTDVRRNYYTVAGRTDARAAARPALRGGRRRFSAARE